MQKSTAHQKSKTPDRWQKTLITKTAEQIIKNHTTELF